MTITNGICQQETMRTEKADTDWCWRDMVTWKGNFDFFTMNVKNMPHKEAIIMDHYLLRVDQ